MTSKFTIQSAINPLFVSAVQASLETSCKDGATVTRDQVSAEFGLGQPGAILIALMLRSGVIPGFAGRADGVCRADVPRVKAEKPYDPAFMSALTKALEKSLPVGGTGALRRVQLARVMYAIDDTIFPDSDTEAEISRALSEWKVPGFGCRRGIHGGVCRMTEAEFKAQRAKSEAKRDAKRAAANPMPPASEPATEPTEMLVTNEGDAEAIPAEAVVASEPVVEPVVTAPVIEEEKPPAKNTKKPGAKPKQRGRREARA